MTEIAPLIFQYDGEAMIPLQPRLADKQYVVGEKYRLVPYEERSPASHNGYFASVTEAHANLPEDIAERLPTPEHLRKYALIKAGFRDERSVVCGSKKEALRVSAWAKQMDSFAVVIAEGATVTSYTAKSQSYRAMGKAEFERSKSEVLRIIAELIGTNAKTLRENTGKAA